MDNLLRYEIEEAEEIIQDNSFHITDKASAEWALRKIRAYKQQIKENEELYNAEIQRLNEWLESVNKKANDNIDYFTALLQEYMIKELEKDPKNRSIKLPSGTVRFRKQQPEWQFDEEKVINWLKNNKPELVKVIEKFDKNDVKKIVKETGEIVDGVKIESREDKFEVDVEV